MRDARFDALRVFSCLTVILLHVSARPLYLHIQGGASHFWWLVGVGISTLTHWCVPVFVMLSGALILRKEVSWPDAYFRRIPRILAVLATSIVIYGFWRRYFIGDFTVSGFFSDVMQGQPYYHLYFFYVVIGLYAVSPALSKIVREVKPETLLGAVIAANVVSLLLLTDGVWRGNYLRDAISFPWDYVGYFCAGAYMAKYRPKAPFVWITVAAYLASLIAVEFSALILGRSSPWTMYAFLYFSPFVIAFSVGVFGFFIVEDRGFDQYRLLSKLAPLTLIVYVIHPMIMESLRYVYVTRIPPLSRLVFDLPLTFAVTALVSFAIAWLLHKVPFVRRVF